MSRVFPGPWGAGACGSKTPANVVVTMVLVKDMP